MTATLSVRKQFTETPGPRYKTQGQWSGEAFRELLVEWLSKHDDVCVDLDGTAGYGSSFIDETFGGLVRSCGFNAADVLRRVTIKSDDDPTYKAEAIQAIEEAGAAKR